MSEKIKPSVTRNQTMCSFTKLALCGSFRVGKIKFTKKIKLKNWTFSGLYGWIEICRTSVRYVLFLSCTDNLIISE